MAERLKWTYRMEEAYDTAVTQCGGLQAAKPKGVFEAMLATGEFPELTLQAVKWHLQSHRRREAREREHGPSTEIKWTGRLEQLYESAVASLGGIWAAKPKDIHAQLVGEFPDITVQSTKWHLYAQRRAEERLRQRQEAATPSSATQQQQQQDEEQQEEQDREMQRSGAGPARPGTKRRQRSRQRRRSLSREDDEEEEEEAPSPHMHRQASSSSLVFLPGPPQQVQRDGAVPAAAAAHALPSLPWDEVHSGVPSLAPAASPTSLQQQQQQLHFVDPAASSAAARPGLFASQAQQQQQQQQQQPVAHHAPMRAQHAPWTAFAYAAACRALVHRQRALQFIRQVVLALEQQASELQMVVQGLDTSSGDAANATLLPLLDANMSDGLDGSNIVQPLAALPRGSLADVPAALLRDVASATAAAQPQRSIAAEEAIGRLHGGGLGKLAAQAGSSGGSSGGAGSAGPAPGTSAGLFQHRVHDPLTCTAPKCRLCAYEQRLQQRTGNSATGPAQQPHPPFLQPLAEAQELPQQTQPEGPPAAAAMPGGQSLCGDASDAMAKAVREASDLLGGTRLVSSGMSAPLLDALLHNLPSLPTLLPHPPPT